MTYSVVEIFPTVQGEGLWTGRRAVFMRFAGCNLWNGRPEDRLKGKGACARWCDTRFVGGEKLTTQQVINALQDAWGSSPYQLSNFGTSSRMVVITGGEPTLQLDAELVDALHQCGWFVAIETNGTNAKAVLDSVDHICVSPKLGSELEVLRAHELKVVLPGAVAGTEHADGWTEEALVALARRGHWAYKFVQPQDVTREAAVEQTYLHALRRGGTLAGLPIAGVQYEAHVRQCLAFIEKHPDWRLSMQTHKYAGVR